MGTAGAPIYHSKPPGNDAAQSQVKKNPMGNSVGCWWGYLYVLLEVRMDQRLGYRWVIYKLYPFISPIYPLF